ncbi:NodT family efflux transporter outer membrane factor (OMF) lipoprotein [Methylobacter tundripaludum]|uniref:NodT family efflux transporter outer membrane factor (OMF) lipoprotein n=2 Tax=Methylobacter tundripaludum TaxID=173365 RepID=A0A2S6HHI6_9GAMM|nr:NodT family efflux transporter outer membrane factor (OMF) lipoprotein [Methylobacter tundripaludum]
MVGPDYRQPQTQLPVNWSTTETASPAAKMADISRWWTVFNDPVLTELMEKAQADNRDLYQAEARLREARARRQLAKANLLPTSSLTASARQSGSSEAAGGGTTSELYSNSLDASWEIDIFGKKRRAIEAAEATMQAAQEDLRDVLVSLCAEVALNYVDVRSYQTRLKITEDNLAAQSETYDITRWRYQAGLTMQLDVDQAKLTMENTRAGIPSLRSTLEQAKHRLALLLGQQPDALKRLLAASARIPAASAEIGVGIPADLLRRRPDVRRAERKLASQTAQIGVAEAARYPDFTLSGSIGLESLAYANLYTAGAKAFQVAANAAWTLLDAGRIRSNINIQNALQEQALGLYQSTLLTALRDVENALTAYSEERKRRDALNAAVEAGISALALADAQYISGLLDFQRVLDSQRSLLSAQTQLATSESEVAADIVRLYKALGGGWHANNNSKQADHE